jgi:cyclic pyranopterin phosphate synthase
VRITGGEPLVRQNIEELIGMIAAVDGVEDLAMTTNAYLLSGYAQKLKDAGLQRITVSLDSLEDDIFQKMNGRGFSTARVLDGIKAAKEAGLQPIKINAVVQKGVNNHTVVGLAEWCKSNGHTPRFIEYMDVGTLNDWKLEQVVAADEIVELIRQKFPADPVGPTYPGEVAKRYRYKDGEGEFGVISSVSQPFCGDCSRMRLSPEGKAVTCLFAESGTDLRKWLRNGSTDDEIKDAIIGIWGEREDRYSEERSEETVKRKKVEMYHIGG